MCNLFSRLKHNNVAKIDKGVISVFAFVSITLFLVTLSDTKAGTILVTITNILR